MTSAEALATPDSPPILGVDPGSNDGAAVLLSADGKTVLPFKRLFIVAVK